MKKYFLFILILVIFCILTGCRSTRLATQTVREVHTDTIYVNKVHYDSIYISHDRTTDYHRGIQSNESVSSVQSVFSHPVSDTLFIHDRTVEYRYRLLRDTVFRTRVDSIPYEVTVVETKAERYVPWWAKLLSWIGILALIILIIRVLRVIHGRI